MKKQLISYDESRFKLLEMVSGTFVEQLQPVMDEFKKITGKNATTEDFNRLIFVPINHVDEDAIKECVFDKITDKASLTFIGRLTFKKKAAYDIFDLPNLDTLFILIGNLKKDSSAANYPNYPGNKFFSLENGLVKISETELEEEKLRCCIYTETDEENQRFEAAINLTKAIVAVIDTISNVGSETYEKLSIDGIVRLDPNGQHIISSHFIKTGNIMTISYTSSSRDHIMKEYAMNLPLREV